jgi:hypothetical protein
MGCWGVGKGDVDTLFPLFCFFFRFDFFPIGIR